MNDLEQLARELLARTQQDRGRNKAADCLRLWPIAEMDERELVVSASDALKVICAAYELGLLDAKQ